MDAQRWLSVSLTIPSTSSKRRLAKTEVDDAKRKVQTAFSDMFGGCTTTIGVGLWRGSLGALVQEKVQIVSSYAPAEHWTQHKAATLALASSVCEALSQDCVLLSVMPATEVYFIEA